MLGVRPVANRTASAVRTATGGERHGQPSVHPPDRLRVGAEDQPDTAPLELLGHQLGQFTVDGRQEAIGTADERRRDAERGEHAWRTQPRSRRRRRRRCPRGPSGASRSGRSRRRRDRRTGRPARCVGRDPVATRTARAVSRCSTPSGEVTWTVRSATEAGGPLQVADAASGEPVRDGLLEDITHPLDPGAEDRQDLVQRHGGSDAVDLLLAIAGQVRPRPPAAPSWARRRWS